MHRLSWLLALLAALVTGGVRADTMVPPASAPPVLLCAQETAAVSIRDSGRTSVTLRVPLALHRGANAFRLYGTRPLTLWDRGRRRDVYRDAFLELSTRSRLVPGTTAWDPLSKQLSWVGSLRPGLDFSSLGGGDLAKAASDLSRRVRSLPGCEHLEALGKALNGGAPVVDTSGPVMAALQLRALATDEAERRLILIGDALAVEAPGVDPALRDGYRAARAEFEEVRKGLWPAIAHALEKNRGRLLLSAIKQIVLSNLGAWAIFGQLGWQAVESALNAEYRGQAAVCLATLAASLAPPAATRPEVVPLALYAEFAVSYQLTEALKTGQIMALKPAGGRTTGGWQIHLSGRCEDLRKALAAG
jgi:hypothetical protein